MEIGCSNGVLSSELAKRCEHLICMDANPTAIQLANQRLTHDHVTVVQGILSGSDGPPTYSWCQFMFSGIQLSGLRRL
ncbi:methyltransferase domain-containing protein [Acinetobacter sp. HR7]|uniref:methyltransferase domain-containing protein n=1 Tax=Acinetobacter sp. HR7 TaxID=1509403 RepID=UPI001D0D2763|nr:methyltransferase domain-containing protein [Acinetobacter sp. HR7]